MEQNSTVVQRVVELVWNRGEVELADALFTPAYVNHGGLISDLVRGPEAMKVSVAFFRTAFPELHVTIDTLIATGDTVELAWTADSSPVRESIPGQDNDCPGRLTGTTLSTLAGGKITESWTEWDRTGVLQRLETLPLDAHG